MPKIQTYWDLAERDRAALTRDEVAAFEAVELMCAGLSPKLGAKPDPEPLPTTPEPITLYAVRVKSRWGGTETVVAFEREEDAKFIVPIAFQIEHDHTLGCDIAKHVVDVAPIHAISFGTAEKHRSVLVERGAIETRNKARADAWSEDVSAREKATRGMWDDWTSCRALAEQYAAIGERFAEFLEIATDPVIAARFLRKSFSAEDVEKARAWTGIPIPTDRQIEDSTGYMSGDTASSNDRRALQDGVRPIEVP